MKRNQATWVVVTPHKRRVFEDRRAAERVARLELRRYPEVTLHTPEGKIVSVRRTDDAKLTALVRQWNRVSRGTLTVEEVAKWWVGGRGRYEALMFAVADKYVPEALEEGFLREALLHRAVFVDAYINHTPGSRVPAAVALLLEDMAHKAGLGRDA